MVEHRSPKPRVVGSSPPTPAISSNAGTIRLFAAAIGPVGILGLPFSIYLPPYIASGGVIPLALVGVLFSICTIWDGVVDPLIGNMIDRKSHGAGAYRRWMLRGIIPMAVLLTLIVTMGNTLNFWLLLPVLLLFYSSFSLYDVAHLGWGAALSRTPADSAMLFGYREFGIKFSLVFAFAAPALAQMWIPGLDLQGRIIAYVSVVALALPIALIAIARLRPCAVEPRPGIGWRAELQASLRSRPLLLLMLAHVLNAFAFGAMSATFIFYVQAWLRLDDVGAMLLLLAFVGAAFATPVWTNCGRRFGKPKMLLAMATWMVACMAVGLWMPYRGHLPLSAVFSVVLGSGFMGLIFINGMIADYVPHDRKQCGRDRSAFLFAISNLIQKIGNAVAIAVAYALLDAIGFDPTAPMQSGAEVRIIWGAVPMLGWGFMGVVAVLLLREPMFNLDAAGTEHLPQP